MAVLAEMRSSYLYGFTVQNIGIIYFPIFRIRNPHMAVRILLQVHLDEACVRDALVKIEDRIKKQRTRAAPSADRRARGPRVR